jgi:DNA-directed RNA polymerase specialized sigma24 family protein
MRTLSEHTTDVKTNPGESIDLRRRLRRELADLIVQRSQALPPADSTLLQSIYGDGRSISSLAPMLGCDVRKLRRRVHRLVSRISSPEFIFVMSHRHRWTASRRRVAEACFVRGLSIKQAAAELSLTYHTVRRHFEALRALVQAATS